LIHRFRLTVMFIASGLFFLTACGPSDSTDQTCQRLDDLQQELAKFEQDPPEDADQRWIAAESIAAEFDNIRDSTQNPELAEAADAFSEFYWAALQVHYRCTQTTCCWLQIRYYMKSLSK